MSDITVDHASLLVDAPGTATLAAVEEVLRAHGFTLGLFLDRAPLEMSVAEWLARGAPGAPSSFADPADHLVAGLEARLPNGKVLVVRPSPRRAVGPDLTALAIGTGDRVARVERAWLRAHAARKGGAVRPSYPLPGLDLDPPLGDDEARLLDGIAKALR
jgi:alkyldihydroxyacetonephosphate synthase